METECRILWHSHRKFQFENISVWVSIKEQIHILTDEKQTPSQHHGVLGCHKRCCYKTFNHLPTWPQTGHRGLHSSFHMTSNSTWRASTHLSTWPQTQHGSLNSFTHMISNSTRGPLSSVGSTEWLLDDPRSGDRILHHATQGGEPSVRCQKFSATSSLLTLATLLPKLQSIWNTVKRDTKNLHVPPMNGRQGQWQHRPI